MILHHKISFNLIEFLTTLVIIGIITLITVSLLSRQPAPTPRTVSQVSAADIGDQFLNLMAGRIESNWEDLQALPDRPDTVENERGLTFSRQPLFNDSNPRVYFAAPTEDFPWDSRFTTKGIFKVEHRNYQDEIDFTGYVRAWKELLSNDAPESAPVLVDISIELTWPGDLAYEERSRIYRNVRLVRPGKIDPSHDALMDLPCRSVWGIEVLEAPTLFYYTLDDTEMTFIGEEGDMLNLPRGTVEGLTCTPNGIYFVYRTPFDLDAELYLIPRGQIDGDADTSLLPSRIGSTGLMDISLAGIHFVEGKLWGIGATSGQVYAINQLTGSCKEVASLSIPGIHVGAFTVEADGNVLVVADDKNGTILYKFDNFPKGDLTSLLTFKSDGPVSCMAAHPNRVVYLYDGTTCWAVDIRSGRFRKQSHFLSAMTDMDFFYEHERDYCADDPFTQQKPGSLNP